MLIVGAKGFAKEVLEIFHQKGQTESIAFYDDVSLDVGNILYQKYQILKKEEEVLTFFTKYGNEFTIGIGNPWLRKKMEIKFKKMGGLLVSSISPYARIGNFGNQLGEGCNIMTGTIITNDIKIGTGALLNLNCTVGHDCVIDDFVELSPGVHISGNCKVGAYSTLGTNSTVLPGVKIGVNVTIGAGSVVTKDVPNNAVAFGVPAKVVKFQYPIDI